MKKSKYIVILITLLLCLSITSFMMAKKPVDDKAPTADTSTLAGDFISGPTPGKWGQYHWLVLYAYAINIPNSPGGPITVYDVPDRFKTGIEDERNKIDWDTHGEDIWMKDSRGKFIRATNLKPGTYYYPSSKITDMNLMIKLNGFTDGENTRLLTILFSKNNFDPNDQITITVSKTTITFSGTAIPFDYVDWSLPAYVLEDKGGGFLLGDWDHDFEITIDK